MSAALRRKRSDAAASRPKGVRFSHEIEYFPPYSEEKEGMSADDIQGEWERQMREEGFDDALAWVSHLLEIHQKFCDYVACVSEVSCTHTHTS